MNEAVKHPPVPDMLAGYGVDRGDYESKGINVGALGNPCDRFLWLNLRRGSPTERFDDGSLSIFEDGNEWEKRAVRDFRRNGCTISGQQATVFFIGNHVRGKIDAIVENVEGHPGEAFVLEIKSMNQKSFDDVQKKGVKESQPTHYGQCQMYMHGLKMDRGIYYAVNKNKTSQRHREIVEYDPVYCLLMLERAERIMASNEAPPKIDKAHPNYPPCLWCRHREICHYAAEPRKHCRTCVFSAPMTDGANPDWHCYKWDREIPEKWQVEWVGSMDCKAYEAVKGLVPEAGAKDA